MDPAEAAAAAHRACWGRVLAGTMRVTRDASLAEDATADAFALALEQWPRDGVPASVEAWLLTVARRRAIDAIRRAAVGRAKLAELAELAYAASDLPAVRSVGLFDDDEIRLVALCCSPRLDPSAQVALTLRLAAGVGTEAIAAGFLVRIPTMAARLTRARQRLTRADLLVLDDIGLEERIPVVRGVIRLAYGLGHTATTGPDLRNDALAAHALRLARTLHTHRPGDAPSAALLALLLFAQARAPGRLDPDGRQRLLETADRRAWDRGLIDEARTLLSGLEPGGAGVLGIEARIAAAYTEPESYAATDWPAVIAAYDAWLTLEPSPVIALGRVAALAELCGPEAGLADLEEVLAVAGESLAGYPYARAARARLLTRLGRPAEARAEWLAAAGCARTDAERAFFAGQASGSDP